MPFIYLIRAHNAGGLHKIGKTIDIERRMRELKAGPGEQVEIIELPDEATMDSAEVDLHRQFADVRVPQSEMFNLTPRQVTECRQAMKSVEAKYAAPPPTPEQVAAQLALERAWAQREAKIKARQVEAKEERDRQITPIMKQLVEGKRARELIASKAIKRAAAIYSGTILCLAIATGNFAVFVLGVLPAPILIVLIAFIISAAITPKPAEIDPELRAEAERRLRIESAHRLNKNI